MADEYGRKPKDLSLRFEVIVNQDTVIPGAAYVGVNQVGSSFSPYGALISPEGVVFERRTDIPPEAQDAVNKAALQVERLSRARATTTK